MSLPHSQVPATCPSSEPDPVRTPTSHFLKIHHNIIPPSTTRSPSWSLSLRCPHQNPVYASPLPHTHYVPHPSHSSRFYVCIYIYMYIYIWYFGRWYDVSTCCIIIWKVNKAETQDRFHHWDIRMLEENTCYLKVRAMGFPERLVAGGCHVF